MKTYLLPVTIAASTFFSFNVSATTHYVDLNCTNPVSPYTDWSTAATNIQDAIFHAGTGDTILVTNGIYQSGGYSLSGSNRVYVSNNLTVQSVNGPAVTMIQGYQVPGTTNGANAVRSVYLSNGTTLSGFTLTNGATQTSGTPYGGGVYCQSTSAVVTNCVIIGNVASSFGGGAYSGTLVNCILSGNVVLNGGDGGGAAYATLINCLLTGNQTGYRGAAAENCTLINCTIVSNVGQADGIDGSKLTNCISYYNSPDNGTGSGDANVFNNCCTIPLPFSGVNIITNPPAFVNLAGGDFHLSAVSPCINSGNNTFITNNTDLDGNPRIVGGIVDLGAYEFQALVRYVSVSNTAPVSPFTNWLTAATNIQDAVDVANAGDFIVVSNGTYKTGGRVVYGALTNRVAVNKAVTVQSVNGPAVTAIWGEKQFSPIPAFAIRCAYLTNGATLVGFTLTNGCARTSGDAILEQSGGGLWCESSSAIISNCIISGNLAQAEFGGGVFGGTLFDCTLTNDSASYGGGAASNMLFNCTLTRNNSSAYKNFNCGGGAYGSALSNCLIVGNQALGGPGFGGGAAFGTLNNCVVSNNAANYGGGVCRGLVNNCLISSNWANNGGGAFSNFLSNCVLERNVAGADGGGAYYSTLVNCTVVSNITIFGTSGGILASVATNSIVYYNLAPQFGPNFFNSAMNYCDTTPLPAGSGNITNEPVFVDLVNGDLHLQSNSPCINAGNNAYVASATDLDGNPRIVGGTVDMGAYEFQNPASVISYAWLQEYSLTNNGSADYADTDGDGMNNWQEWMAGTNPTNALSVLKMTSATPTNNPAGLVVTWQSVTNRTYFLQRATDLTAQPAFSSIQSNIVGQVDTTSYTDTTATDSGPYFYRVGIQP